MKLSDRMQTIAGEIENGEIVADIGTDHGLLPLYLYINGISPHVIMTDISEGSLAKAEANCKLICPETEFDLRQGDGIDVLSDGEADAVIIAGMGGLLITDILEWNMMKSRSFGKYIFQPRNKAGRLRHWLYCNGFNIVREHLVHEGKFICEIITAEPGGKIPDVFPEYGADFDYPMRLAEIEGEVTGEYLHRKLSFEENILKNIQENSTQAEDRKKIYQDRVNRLKLLISMTEE